MPERIAMARRLGADHVVDFRAYDPVAEIMRRLVTEAESGAVVGWGLSLSPPPETVIARERISAFLQTGFAATRERNDGFGA